MNTTQTLNNLNCKTSTCIDKVKTIYPIFSKYSDYKGNINFVYIPSDIELYVTEIYPNYGVDVWYEDRNIFLDFNEVELVGQI